jgi:hypothetical protein
MLIVGRIMRLRWGLEAQLSLLHNHTNHQHDNLITYISLQLPELSQISIMADPSPSMPSIPDDLSAYRIPCLPLSFYYIPNFLTEYEEAQILSKAP